MNCSELRYPQSKIFPGMPIDVKERIKDNKTVNEIASPETEDVDVIHFYSPFSQVGFLPSDSQCSSLLFSSSKRMLSRI